VDVRFILNPLTDPHELATLTHLYCHDHLLLLLQNTVARCPNARIIVTGYFPILSAQSDPDLLHLFLQTHFINIPTLPELEETFTQPPREVIFDKVVTLATTFWQTSTSAMQAAVQDLGSNRVGFALAPFTAANATLAPSAWLWGVNLLLQPQDPMKDARRLLCDAAETDLLKRFICHRASAGHPNLLGAQQFAQAILATMS
jgi:hypothetical protein